MTAVGGTSVGGVADALMSGVGSDYRLCVEYWREQVEGLKCRVEELEAELEASTAVDLLDRYRLVCVEKDSLARSLAASERRLAALRASLATARAQAEALRGNR